MPKIQTGLGLDRDTYRSFYTEIEGILAKNGWDQLRFRSSVQKSAIFDALIPLVTTNGILHERFPDTVRRVETKAGRMALEGMVYKICCNVRRRKRQPGTTTPPWTSAKDDSSSDTRLEPLDPMSGIVCGSHANRSETTTAGGDTLSQWTAPIWVTEIQSEAPPQPRILSRICDLMDGWPACARGPILMSKPNYFKFCSLLTMRGYDRRRVTWAAQSHKERVPVDGELDWTAALHAMIDQGPRVEFNVVKQQR